ncbi:MAG TPA: 6-carboxytetrahydropterin synthase [Bacteroidales bacterium]|nr:6-carboxytetrahydropterin synthase [Bacteroidales bacterium]
MIYLTRRERFCAAHRMFREDWSDEVNYKIFGKCSNPNWHGHNYILWVTVKGELSDENGFVMNINILKQIVLEKIINKIDHKNINLEVSFMKGKIATTENLAVSIWDELKPSIEKEGASLHCIKVQETENNSIEYYG